jgi:hypothetical protein
MDQTEYCKIYFGQEWHRIISDTDAPVFFIGKCAARQMSQFGIALVSKYLKTRKKLFWC